MIVFNIYTGELEERKCMIHGKGDVYVPPTPPPSDTETEIQKQILAQMQTPSYRYTTEDDVTKQQEYVETLRSQIEGASNEPITAWSGGAPGQGMQATYSGATDKDKLLADLKVAENTLAQMPTWQQQSRMQDYTGMLLEQQIADMPLEREYRETSMALLQEQIAYSREQLNRLKEAKDIGEITGDLTEEEISQLDQLQENAITNLTEVVGRDAQDVVKKEIASLVDRGVLQGNIGARAIGQIGERATELIATGTRDIESTRISQQLALQEGNKNRNLQLQQLVQQGVLTREQAIQQMASGSYGMAQAQQYGQQQMGLQSQQFSQQLGQQWEQAKIGAGIQQWGQMAGMRGAQADRAMQGAIAQSQAQASIAASQWGAFGTAAGLSATAAILSSAGFKDDIERIDEAVEQRLLDTITDLPIYTYKYKEGIGDDENHIGVITEESPPEIVTKDGKKLDVLNYLGYLTACVKTLSKQVEVLRGN